MSNRRAYASVSDASWLFFSRSAVPLHLFWCITSFSALIAPTVFVEAEVGWGDRRLWLSFALAFVALLLVAASGASLFVFSLNCLWRVIWRPWGVGLYLFLWASR